MQWKTLQRGGWLISDTKSQDLLGYTINEQCSFSQARKQMLRQKQTKITALFDPAWGKLLPVSLKVENFPFESWCYKSPGKERRQSLFTCSLLLLRNLHLCKNLASFTCLLNILHMFDGKTARKPWYLSVDFGIIEFMFQKFPNIIKLKVSLISQNNFCNHRLYINDGWSHIDTILRPCVLLAKSVHITKLEHRLAGRCVKLSTKKSIVFVRWQQ